MTGLQKINCKGEKHVINEVTLLERSARIEGRYYLCDVLEGLSELLRGYKGRIQIVYMDPPFVTGKLFEFKQKIGEEGWSGNREYVINHTAYDDQWEGGMERFLTLMRKVLEHAYELLSPEGCIYLHVDYRTSAHLRLLMDEIFGERNFLNEIIWYYKSGGRSKRYFSRKHDTILFYRRSPDYYFNIEAVGKPRGKEKKNHMKKQIDDDGRVFWTIKVGGREYRYYEDSIVYPVDVWDDISHLQQKDPERTGYDTQKPEALLERIIKVSSRPGDIVADFFAGSGTTLAVAQKLGRNWLGIDKSCFSLHTSRRRLVSINRNAKVYFFYGDMARDAKVEPSDIKVDYRASGGEITIMLKEYRSPLEKNLADKGLKLKNLDCVDYWAAGYIHSGIFSVYSFSVRDSHHPDLAQSLTIERVQGKMPAIHVVDVFGNQFFYKLLVQG